MKRICSFDCPEFHRTVISGIITPDGEDHTYCECRKKRYELQSMLIEDPQCKVEINNECKYYK